jgi:hypothetical protein
MPASSSRTQSKGPRRYDVAFHCRSPYLAYKVGVFLNEVASVVHYDQSHQRPYVVNADKKEFRLVFRVFFVRLQTGVSPG